MHNEPDLLNFMHPGLIEAGCDEAGRGPLAGPVFAASVILPADFHHPLLNDSKKMTQKSRELLREVIEKEAVAWAVEKVDVSQIDTMNILNASITGMQRAVRRLKVRILRLQLLKLEHEPVEVVVTDERGVVDIISA